MFAGASKRRRGGHISGIRVLVGTRKGAFILTADGARKNWTVTGQRFGGREIYHLKGSPVDQSRLYAAQSTGWFGQLIQRSDDGVATWEPVGHKFTYEGRPGEHLWYDGTPRPWEFKRVWLHQERLGALSSRRKATGVPQPDRWQRVEIAHPRSAPKRLLRQSVA